MKKSVVRPAGNSRHCQSKERITHPESEARINLRRISFNMVKCDVSVICPPPHSALLPNVFFVHHSGPG